MEESRYKVLPVIQCVIRNGSQSWNRTNILRFKASGPAVRRFGNIVPMDGIEPSYQRYECCVLTIRLHRQLEATSGFEPL